MAKQFFKSALAAPDSSALDDSSLALPAGPDPPPAATESSADRTLRVHRQVQLTLARRARKSEPSGSIRLQKSMAKSFDAPDGLLSNMKINGMGLADRSLSSNNVRGPSRRVEVSPPPSPELPHNCFTHSTPRHGMYTHPGRARSHRSSGALDHSLGSGSFRRYAFSEAPRGTRPLASTAADGTLRRRSLRQQTAAVANAALQRRRGHGSRWGPAGVVTGPNEQEERGGASWRQAGDGALGAVSPPSEARMARARWEGPRRMNSYPPSAASVEVDTGRQLGAEVLIQRMHSQNVTPLQSEDKPAEMTLERAVNLLTQDDEDTLISAASNIQSHCFRSDDAKRMVYYLRGIGKLLQLLCSDDEVVQRAAAGALRNVVYQSSENKMEVKDNNGLDNILHALKSSRNLETRRELTGLLWNLSSHDLLKECLSKEALLVLTQSVLEPSSGISEGENPKDELLADADAFYNATGCLRNLSSAGPDCRKAMRECENFIDSLVYYIRGAVADHKTDDKSTENCVCILHNLSYQMEAELPKRYTVDLRESLQNLAPEQKAIGCFSYRSAKITEHLDQKCPLLEEKANPRGIEWLWSAITIRMYLSLMARSVRHYTQQAAVGALQNITAGNGAVTEAIAFTIVQRENGLQHVRKMFEEGENNVKRTCISLIRNLSRYQELHPDIVKQMLPEVVGMLPNDDTGTDLPTEVTASLCQILINLSQGDTQQVRAILNQGALQKIINISSKDRGYGPTRAGQAACILLHTMWKRSDLRGAYRKGGYRKADFINARTTKAVNSR